MEQKDLKRSYRLFVGVDIASPDFTATSVAAGTLPTREAKSYEQTAHGFERFMKRLQESCILPAEILVVMEATGSYWVALATALYQAGFAVRAINSAQAQNARQSTTEASKERCTGCPDDCAIGSSSRSPLLDASATDLL